MSKEPAFEMFEKVGGPAFPSEWNFPDGGSATCPGMTLRDWFAGQALAGMFRHDGWLNTIDDDQVEVSRRAFKIADAMLSAREAQP